jgi:hypothetical protein
MTGSLIGKRVVERTVTEWETEKEKIRIGNKIIVEIREEGVLSHLKGRKRGIEKGR